MSPTPEQELQRLRCLQTIKKDLTEQKKYRERGPSPFAVERISRSDRTPPDWTIPSIHQDVFDHLLKEIRQTHSTNHPRIIALTGATGMGKSHLLARFNDPKLIRDERYLLVRCPGSISSEELQKVLLDRLLTALTAPSPLQPHLLLDRISEIAFNALRQLVESGAVKVQETLNQSRMQRLRSWFVRGPGLREVTEGLKRRDLAVFRLLDEKKFFDFVSSRYLPEPSQPFHRIVLRVLFAYLDPDQRDLVLSWLRGNAIEEMQADAVLRHEQVAGKYEQGEVLKILMSLFSQEISAGLQQGASTERGREADLDSRVFLFTFDHLEGQIPLYSSDAEWQRYFGHLADLYHRLNNVVFVFPTPRETIERLQVQMEAAFSYRIPLEGRFHLAPIQGSHATDLYTSRLRWWLGPDAEERLRLAGETLPLSGERVRELAQETPVLRDFLSRLDQEFRNYLQKEVHDEDPRVDYLYHLAQIQAAFVPQRDHKNVISHPDTITVFLNEFGRAVARLWGLIYDGLESVADIENGRLLAFLVPGKNARVKVYLVFLTLQYQKVYDAAVALLAGTWRDRTFLYLIRHDAVAVPENRQGQAFCHSLPLDHEQRLQALRLLLRERETELGQGGRLDDLVREEINRTYLGSMFDRVREAVRALVAQPQPAVSAPPAEDTAPVPPVEGQP